MINFNSITEDFRRELDAVLRYYLVGGQTRAINGNDVDFYDCRLRYDIAKLYEEAQAETLIVIAGNRTGAATKFKCDGKYEFRAEVLRTVYVKRSLQFPLEINSAELAANLVADRTWDQLQTIVSTQQDRFAFSEIFDIELDVFPVQVPHLTEYILRGNLKCEVRPLIQADQFIF